MDNLIQDMGLTEENAELLTSGLMAFAKSYLQDIQRHLNFTHFFTVSQPHSLCYCSDKFELFNEIGIDYDNF